jgi:hypothetical protein
MVSIGERACLLALGCISRLPSLAMGMLRCSIGTLLYTYYIYRYSMAIAHSHLYGYSIYYSIYYSTQSFGLSLRFGLRPSVSIPYPYATPNRAMLGSYHISPVPCPYTNTWRTIEMDTNQALTSSIDNRGLA